MSKKKLLKTVFVILAVLLVVSGIYTSWQLYKASAQKKAQTLPPEIDVYKIVPASCEDCFDIDVAEQFIQQTSNAKIITSKTLKTDTEEAKEFIIKYKLKKLPAVVLKGEINRITLDNFEEREDALVFDETPPVYFDVATGKTKGKVTATIINDNACKECLDLTILTKQLRSAGVSLTEKVISSETTEAQSIIKRYKIEKLPTLILSQDAGEYGLIQNVWEQVGTKETDNTFVLRKLTPPYKDLVKGQIIKEPTIIFITDKTCKECYNATLHKNLLAENFGMTFKKEEYVDFASREGTKLALQYKIKLVPTIIVSQEAGHYPGFEEVWQRIGEKTHDGSFIFTNAELLKGMSYKDVKSGKIIKVEQNK
ncbi:hypothetical protein HY484_02650 [Candidatus Woesearchaeota archaeon]|nr:hypothetical protein [Candidatus Woesearchaeota archaeon]